MDVEDLRSKGDCNIYQAISVIILPAIQWSYLARDEDIFTLLFIPLIMDEVISLNL